jgi:hypothetical protein
MDGGRKKMKEGRRKISVVWVMLLFAVALLLLMAATVSAVEGPAVIVTHYNVEPEALMPGDNGVITLTIKNPFIDTQSSESETIVGTPGTVQEKTTATQTRGTSAEIKTIRLSSKGSDIEWLQSGLQRTEFKNVGALGPGESITVSVPIKAGAYAKDGTYFPEVYIEVENGKNVRFPVSIKVDSSEVALIEKNILSELSLSESKKIEIEVANNRPNAVNGVSVLVESRNNGLEFTPEGIFIGNLGPDEKRTVDFTITPLHEGDADIYLEAEYKNGDNVHHSELSSFVVVQDTANVKLILVNAPEFVHKGDTAKIEFDVANGMAKDIEAVSVVPANEEVKLLPSEYFIGDMEVGDIFSASFDLHTSDLSVGDTEIPFKLLYRDVESDKRYEIPGYEVHIEVRELQESGLSNLMLASVAAVVLIVVAVVVVLRVKRKRGMREKR